MTPIKRGTARRLGLEQPIPPEPFSWERVGLSLAAAERDLQQWRPGGIVLGPGAGRDHG